jgi:nucleoside-diphosphate-sugar epimerase
VENLLERGVSRVRCLTRSRGTRVPDIARRYPDARIEAQAGNILSPADLERALDGIETVFHLAADMKGAPAELYMNTVVGSKRLLECGKRVKRFVLVSTFGVYGVDGLKSGSIIDENTPLERHPEQRDAYSFAKHRQELLFREYQQKAGFELVVLRPGVVYGPPSSGLSTRIGLKLPFFFLHVGGRNKLPLTFVENCADAVAMAGMHTCPIPTVNVVDDNLITSREYLRRYERASGLRSIRVPYVAAMAMSSALAWYSKISTGQLPAVLTPYRARAYWSRHRFTNERLKSIGWTQNVPTQVALETTFTWLAGNLRRQSSANQPL